MHKKDLKKKVKNPDTKYNKHQKKYQLQIQDILDELCKEFNLPVYAMDAICTSPYKFIFMKMREEKFFNFNLPRIGKLYVQNGRKSFLLENWQRIKEERKLERAKERELRYQAIREQKEKQEKINEQTD